MATVSPGHRYVLCYSPEGDSGSSLISISCEVVTPFVDIDRRLSCDDVKLLLVVYLFCL